MQIVSVERGMSWLPATTMTCVSGNASTSRENWRKACRIAVLVGRTVWKTSPPRRITSGARSMSSIDHRARERLRDVGFALVDARRRLPLELAEAEMQVGEVDEAHGRQNIRAEPRDRPAESAAPGVTSRASTA